MNDYNTPGILDNIERRLVQANTGKRFANYIIDVIVNSILVVAAWLIAEYIKPGALRNHLNTEGAFDLMFNLISSFAIAILFGLTEGIFKGKTLGKLITGTRAVSINGGLINFNTAFTRGIIRAIPFEQLSALGQPCYPWHDRWSKTIVIDEALSNYQLNN